MKKVFFVLVFMLINTVIFANNEISKTEINYKHIDLPINNESDVVGGCRSFTVTVLLGFVEISTDLSVCCECSGVMCQGVNCWVQRGNQDDNDILTSFIDVSDILLKYGNEIKELKIKESSSEKITDENFKIKSGTYEVINKNGKYFVNTKLEKIKA